LIKVIEYCELPPLTRQRGHRPADRGNRTLCHPERAQHSRGICGFFSPVFKHILVVRESHLPSGWCRAIGVEGAGLFIKFDKIRLFIDHGAAQGSVCLGKKTV
jgi:hypothetical protein